MDTSQIEMGDGSGGENIAVGLWIAQMRSPSDSVLKELAGASARTAGCTDPKKGA